VTDAARKQISIEGYDPVYGARPLKRIIQQRLQNPLATEILRGRIPAGSGVRIDHDGEEFSFTPMAGAAASSSRKDRPSGGSKVETVGVG
jgi:ATP-dependent Clp protease ATP-binding subunit ClpB